MTIAYEYIYGYVVEKSWTLEKQSQFFFALLNNALEYLRKILQPDKEKTVKMIFGRINI